MKADPLEDIIRRCVRLQTKLRREGVELRWTLTYVPCEPTPAPKKKRRS